ncbi:ResC/HemX-like cytochrome c biogenesis membrane protein [Citrifermentans bemidjiense Bem]|uniref:ResC/HemX-like cytochrome c biogenesis membrane protein n=1 Tax=Citrifermentans bemidjiense (strain ATCC BAA-1014 / DSM 16622 / JCM 12645 / Bem) TaxID=404380 RepID=B5EHH0_CITBB|nr:cytochrome c biogenesis protein CcsA [Citrifermentans bemidjiense]ACH38180.1 ResC/HemX-like cytochrome c biogenesis membrane protein [Citrifermentans bemidjiense Bem]
MKPELICFWLAVALYGVSAFSYIFGLIGKFDKLFLVGLLSALAGFVPHTASIGLRWTASGVEPFITISESITFGVFMAVLLFLIFQLTVKKVAPLGVLVMPISFVLMGWAGTLMKEVATSLNPALQSAWLWVHIVGATSGFASVLIAAGLGLIYLLKQKNSGGIYDRLPELGVLDTQSYRFVAGGFIMYGLMIISGAYWSNTVKGNYWAWDPVEVWSLISWLIYGIYLHLRVTFGWRGSRLAWYSLAALVVMIVSYWGIPFSMETFHSGFRIDHT